MKIVATPPPNYEEICKVFPVRNLPAVFAYGNILHTTNNAFVSADLKVHEQTHSAQQGAIGGPKIWWDKYISDPEFRLEQEIQAYRMQYQFAVKFYNRHERRALLAKISKDLSSPMYGKLVSKEEAKELIQDYDAKD